MNIVIAGSRVQVYGEDVKTYKCLPNGCYNICFNQMTGFYLSTREDLEVSETVIYGNHNYKVNKVMNSFDKTERNFGVILSGAKGCGKSLLARLLANKCIENNIPVITVTEYYSGIADFIASIDQKVMVLFDEFEKVFSEHKDYDPQVELLTLFDGIDNGNKLFVITCNNIRRLNDYLLNRPGRFHYHFMISNPESNEIENYLLDKLKPEYHNLIPRLIRLAKVIDITYDYLRAITFDINQGYSIEETFSDLNISRGDDQMKFNIHVIDNLGEEWTAYNIDIKLFSTSVNTRCYFSMYNKGNRIDADFAIADLDFNGETITLSPDKLDVDYTDDPEFSYGDDLEKDRMVKEKWNSIKSVVIKKQVATTTSIISKF